MAPTVRRIAALLPLFFCAAAVFAAPAIADSTEDFPIPRRIIATPCDGEQYLAAARDTSPVYFDRYMRDKSNRPADVQQSAVDRIHWFFHSTRREGASTPRTPPPTSTTNRWPPIGTRLKIFFNNKGVVAKATEVCMNYPRGDMSVWGWLDG